MKTLVVAEKPSVGRDIARVLNCTEREDGYIAGDEHVVTWAIGHLVENCMPDEFDPRYEEWKREDLPIIPDPIPLKVIEQTKNQYETVASLMNSPEIGSIICATDAGREGELIFRYIYQMADCHKPVKRLWISSMTPQAIREGFQKLRSSAEYDSLYQSALCRSDADWLIGINASRVYSINLQAVLSVGRVQSPTLAMIVQREKERRSFVPEKYGTLQVRFSMFNALWFDPKQTEDISTRISEADIGKKREFAATLSGAIGIVRSFISEKKNLPAPLLYDLTALQREANRTFGYSAKKTLSAAQDLYEKRKAITYPRTDSRYLSHDLVGTLKNRLEKLSQPSLDSSIEQARSSDKNLFGRYINDAGVSDHHAIIPTGYTGIGSDWSAEEKNIFELVAKRFISMFLPDIELEEQTAVIEAEDNLFRAKGQLVISRGWIRMSSASYDHIPVLTLNQAVRIIHAEVKEEETQPPAPHTEASLLYAMEHVGEDPAQNEPEQRRIGLGTPATRAETIEKLIHRGYVRRTGRALHATEDGMNLIELLPEELTSPNMTVQWEKRLAGIASGEDAPASFMEGIRSLTVDVVKTAPVVPDVTFGPKIVGTCHLCGNRVLEGRRQYYCRNRDCDFYTWKAQKGVHPYLSPDEISKLLEEKTLKTGKGTYILSQEEPYVLFEYAETVPMPDEVKQQKKTQLMKILAKEGVEAVDKTLNGGAIWIPGGDERKPLISKIAQPGIEFHYSKDSKALKHKPGWWTDPNQWKILQE